MKNKIITRKLLSNISIGLIISSSSPASANSLNVEIQATTTAEIDQLTREIVTKELELQRLNAMFRLYCVRVPWGRTWRQFFYTETNAGCTLASNVARMAQSYPYTGTPPLVYSKTTKIETVVSAEKPGVSSGKSNTSGSLAAIEKSIIADASKALEVKVSSKRTSGNAEAATKKVVTITAKLGKAASANKYSVADSSVASMIGQVIAATGESSELSANLLRYAIRRWRHKGSAEYRKEVKELAEQIDRLLLARETSIKNSTLLPRQFELVEAEGVVLRDLRDLSLSQYVQYHSNAKRLAFLENGTYVGSISKNLMGATGNILNINSSVYSNTPEGAYASLFSALAGVATVSTPAFAGVSSSVAERLDRRVVKKDIGSVQAKTAEKLKEDRKTLNELLEQKALTSMETLIGARERNEIYKTEEQLFLADERTNLRQQNKLRTHTLDRVAVGAIQGSSRVSQGVLGMVGGWEYPKESWIRNRYTAAGSTAYGAGTAVNLVDTFRARVTSEIESRKLKRLHLLPAQVLADRIQALASMQKSVEVLANAPGARQTQTAATGSTH